MIRFRCVFNLHSISTTALLLLAVVFLLGCDQPSPPTIIFVSPEVESLEPESAAALAVESLPTPTLDPQLSGESLNTANDSLQLAQATPTAEFSPTPLPTPTATKVLPPSELLESGLRQIELENMAAAEGFFRRLLDSPDSSAELVSLAQFNLGIALVAEDQIGEAKATWADYTQNSTSIDATVWYRLAQIETDSSAAEAYYLTFLESHPELGAYVYPKLARLNPDKQEEYYLAALNTGAWYRETIDIRRDLADLYIAQERYAEAVAQYEAIRTAAFTAFTKGEITYKIGETWELAGNDAAAIESWQFGMSQFPTAYESYLGLSKLVEREIPVDQFQRGLVDYHAGVYGPGIEAFNTYIAANPENYRPDTHLFLAWSYEQTKQFDAALESLNDYLALNPEDRAVIGTYYVEKSTMETRSISTATAVETLTDFIANYPEHPEMPYARWRRAVLADRFLLQPELAIPYYEEFVAFHPQDENSSAALLRLGLLHDGSGNRDAALGAWEQATQFADNEGRASLLWLLRNGVEPPADSAALSAVQSNPGNYYSLRVNALLNEQVDVPFSTSTIDLTIDPETEQADTEQWLAQTFGLDGVSSQLPAEIAGDGRLIRGRNLWRIGERDAAKWELESLRKSYSEDPVASYQIAIELKNIGLFRSSILAANTTLIRSGASIYNAPLGLARLIYPTYYSDMVLPLSDEYGYDPLLHFSLIRQESLFEGFATSSAYAQGLSQIIPDTGTFVAQRLSWPGYENSDLYKPHISLIFGAYYFDQQLQLFEGFYPAALAAYNGGPGNAIRWYDEAGSDPDLYLETINFSETRLYLRTITSNYQIYKQLYGRP